MKAIGPWALVWAFAGALTATAAPANAQNPPVCHYTHVAGPTPQFGGVTYRLTKISCQDPDGTTHATLAHIITANVSLPTVTLDASGLQGDSFSLALPSTYLTQTGARIAVNANLFVNCCSYVPPANAQTLLRGWEVSGGQTLSPPANDPAPAKGFPFNASLVQLKNRTVEIVYSGKTNTLPTGVMTAVTGSHMLVFGGQVIPVDGADPEFFGPNARTLAGVSADGGTLRLVTLDRSPGGGAPYSGLTLYEAGVVLAHLGAGAAINLDGGGSSSMVRQLPGVFAFLNAPSDPSQDGVCTVYYPSQANAVSCERYVGASLGLHALFLPGSSAEHRR